MNAGDVSKRIWAGSNQYLACWRLRAILSAAAEDRIIELHGYKAPLKMQLTRVLDSVFSHAIYHGTQDLRN